MQNHHWWKGNLDCNLLDRTCNYYSQLSDCLLNLKLTGYAAPSLHSVGEGKVERNGIGFLAWNKDEDANKNLKIGSRLKSPSLPIWVTCLNDNGGVLFNPVLMY